MVFRSVFVPIKAALGFLLSVFASLGATVAIFQWGWLAELIGVENPGPILSFLPILLMAVLFGLAMDYEVFLVSGMREEFVKTGNARESIIVGFAHAGRVVTAAALIMFFVFFAFVPEGTGAIKGIAFALAVGVFLDAFLVRMTLVPAAMALAGNAAWWLPRWLARVLPNVDIEGVGLRQHLADSEWASRQDATITAEALVVGLAGSAADDRGGQLGPIDLSVAAGSIVTMAGTAVDRRVLAATLAGRLDPVSGRLQVLRAPLPSERTRALRMVALADVGAGPGAGGTVGDLIGVRLSLTLPNLRPPGLRVSGAGAQLAGWIDRLNAALGIRLNEATSLSSLTALERAAVIVAAALAERPGVVFVDLGDMPVDPAGRDLVTVLAALAPATTTLVLGAASFGDLRAGRWAGLRAGQHLDLTLLALPSAPIRKSLQP
jgi:RND superfamily putative drug exporter